MELSKESTPQLFQRFLDHLRKENIRIDFLPDAGGDEIISLMSYLGYSPVERTKIRGALCGHFGFEAALDTGKSEPAQGVPAQGDEQDHRGLTDGNCGVSQHGQDNAAQGGQHEHPDAPADGNGDSNMIVTPVPTELSQPAQGNSKEVQAEKTLGRSRNTKEPSLSTKLSIINHSLEKGYIENPEPGLYKKSTPMQKVNFKDFGDTAKLRCVMKVREWANQSAREGWKQLAADEQMQNGYGPNPLALIRIVVRFGAVSLVLFRARRERLHP